MQDFNNSILDFEALDQFINNYDFINQEDYEEEEMFKRSQHSAFVPYQKPQQPQFFIPSQQASLFLGKMDLPLFERVNSNKPMREEEIFTNCLS